MLVLFTLGILQPFKEYNTDTESVVHQREINKMDIISRETQLFKIRVLYFFKVRVFNHQAMKACQSQRCISLIDILHSI